MLFALDTLPWSAGSTRGVGIGYEAREATDPKHQKQELGYRAPSPKRSPTQQKYSLEPTKKGDKKSNTPEDADTS